MTDGNGGEENGHVPHFGQPCENCSMDWQAEYAKRRLTYATDVMDAITQNGWTIQPVFPTENEEGVSFAYSIGLGQTELMVRGFGEHCSAVATWLCEEASNGRLDLAEAEPQVIGDKDCRVLVEPWRGDPAEFGFAHVVHPGELFRMVQVLLPDDDGRLPREPGCEVEEYQIWGLPV